MKGIVQNSGSGKKYSANRVCIISDSHPILCDIFCRYLRPKVDTMVSRSLLLFHVTA